MTETKRPPVKKTSKMLEVERNHDGMDIRDIIVSAMRACETRKEAAEQVGISESNLSHWQHRLQIVEEIAGILQLKKLGIPLDELNLQIA